ncbi:MAG: tetraacyldisaccharide 4'-kinase [Labrys sp. (in: a-proteobacteria)]|jgi:tetraacyldisaccharide 4'-kinase
MRVPRLFTRPPAFWQRRTPGLVARLLSPIGQVYGARVAARMARAGRRVEVPVLCVGNFTLGGSGKTPMALAIAELLIEAGERPVFLTRGYGGSIRGPALVDTDDRADRVGDEPLLLARLAPTIVAADRVAGAQRAIEAGASVIIMDDGFQNPSLAKSGAIVVVDGEAGIGNGLSFPAGPLRAPLYAQTPFATAVVIIGPGEAGERVAAYARGAARPVFRAALEPAAAPDLAGRRVLAFAGIGRPEKFQATLAAMGAEIAAFEAFPDHHPYSEAEAVALATRAQAERLLPVTTEKDHARLSGGPARKALASMSLPVPVGIRFEDEAGIRRLLLGLLRH